MSAVRHVLVLTVLASMLLVARPALHAKAYPMQVRNVAMQVDPPIRLFWANPGIGSQAGSFVTYSAAFDPATPGLGIALVGQEYVRTADSGLTWKAVSLWERPSSTFNAGVVYGGFKGTFYSWNDSEIAKTTDGGLRWTKLSAFSDPCYGISGIVVHPAEPLTLYVGTRDGIVRSYDGGQTFVAEDSFLCRGGPIPSAIGISRAQPEVVYVGQPEIAKGGVYRSNDRGATWQQVSNGLPEAFGPYAEYQGIQGLVVDPSDVDIVYAFTVDSQYKTTNGGQSWSLVEPDPSSTQPLSFNLDPYHGNTFYGTNGGFVYISEDNGTTWVPVHDPIPGQGAEVLAIDPNDANRIIAVSSNGLFISLENKGRTSLPLVIK